MKLLLNQHDDFKLQRELINNEILKMDIDAVIDNHEDTIEAIIKINANFILSVRVTLDNDVNNIAIYHTVRSFDRNKMDFKTKGELVFYKTLQPHPGADFSKYILALFESFNEKIEIVKAQLLTPKDSNGLLYFMNKLIEHKSEIEKFFKNITTDGQYYSYHPYCFFFFTSDARTDRMLLNLDTISVLLNRLLKLENGLELQLMFRRDNICFRFTKE